MESITFKMLKLGMTTEIMQEVLRMLDKKMIAEGRKVLLFLDNAPFHTNVLQEGLKNMKLEFLPKNITSRLQPCDTGIINKFKHKYRKLLICYILARVDTCMVCIGNYQRCHSRKSSNEYRYHGLR